MPPRKPHPRSLDALFPRQPIKRCAWGHTQTPGWRTVHGCSTCRKDEEAFAARQLERTRDRQGLTKREREQWYRENPVPAVLISIETSTGKVTRHSIPPHCRKRRGPAARRGVKRRP